MPATWRAQMPKLRWIKEQLPRTWSRMRQAFDLADWLGYRATGKVGRCGTAYRSIRVDACEGPRPGV